MIWVSRYDEGQVRIDLTGGVHWEEVVVIHLQYPGLVGNLAVAFVRPVD